MSTPATLVWFRLDLRLRDNPALAAAGQHGGAIVPVFIWSPEEEAPWPPGAASRWWLHHSLTALQTDLRARGLRLIIRRGPSVDALRSLAKETGATVICWNRRYEPALSARDTRVTQALLAAGLKVSTFNSALLFEPGEIQTRTGGPYQVFTPFWRTCLAKGIARPPAARRVVARGPSRWPKSLTLDQLELLPKIDWARGFNWQPGEAGAQQQLRGFVAESMRRYPDHRDRPDLPGTSRLAPHLHFGEIAPQQVWAAARSEPYRRQLIWREFAHHLLYHFPHTPAQPLRPQFEKFPWSKSGTGWAEWKRGRTGFPIVDAGLRALWTTGWMHNRVRMIVASFLVKDLLLPWQEGARWFWDTLVDADLANNTLGWQWVAGCGADAAPFFRIFNPTCQAEKFDPHGDYVRRWVPELGTVNYPAPIVEHNAARHRALRALAEMKT